jgi:hypothetical protein
MEAALGPAYSRHWASHLVLAELGGHTVEESLADGTPPKRVWRAVWAALDLPLSER